MNELITISNVRGYIDENGTAQLNLEDVSRGLGFTDNSKDVEYVRWNRVFAYLAEFKFATSGEKPENQFIPENIFYRLAMKAKNETAEIFQAEVADEILPAIRKTGTYSISQPSPLEALQQIVTCLTEQDRKQKELESRTEKVESSLTIVKDTIIQRDDNWRDSTNIMINRAVKHSDRSYQEMRTESYKILEERAGCDLNARLRNMRHRHENAGIAKSKINALTKMDVIEDDKRLKEIYTAIVKELIIKYVA